LDGALHRVAQVTLGGAEAVVRTLVRQGEVAADRAEQVLDDLLGRSENNREAITALVTGEIDRAVGRLGLVRAQDLDGLRERVAELEARIASLQGPKGPAPGPAVGERR